MRIENLKEKINKLKDQAINNVDKHFNEFIIEELQEGFAEDPGYYIIDDYNYYSYWLELAIDLEPIISGLLESNDFETEEEKLLLLDCIDIKKVIDSKLAQCKIDEDKLSLELRKEISEDVGYKMESNIYNDHHILTPFLLSGDEKKQNEIIETIYNFLTSEWLAIDATLELFMQHYSLSSEQIPLIPWKKPLKYLAEFFKLLYQNSIIINPINTDKDKCKLIVSHFSVNQKPMKLKSLISTWPYSIDDSLDQPSKFIEHLNNKFYIN